MTDFDRSEYVRFPERLRSKVSLGSAQEMVTAARQAEEKEKRLRDEPAATASQDVFAAAEEEKV
jgi:hypothetical protein